MTDAEPTLSTCSPAGAPASALDRARALVEPQLRLLGRLAEIGMDVAEAVGRQARGEEPAKQPDLSLAFARASRAVRLTVGLQSRLVDALAALEAGVVPGGTAPNPDPDYVLKARVERIVERAAEAEHEGDAVAVDALVRETAERLDDIDLYGDLLDRPMSEIVARIGADLGLSPDWSAMAREAWAQAEMAQSRLEGGDPGTPLKALLDALDDQPPPLPAGPRRTSRLAATARRGLRAEKAKVRPPAEEYSGPIEVQWLAPT